MFQRSKSAWPAFGLVLALGALAAAIGLGGRPSAAQAQPTAGQPTTQPVANNANFGVPAEVLAPPAPVRHGAWRPESIWEYWGVVIGWSVLVILLLVVGYKVFDWLTPRIDFNGKLNEGNIAVAIVIAAFLLATALVIHAVVSIQ